MLQEFQSSELINCSAELIVRLKLPTAMILGFSNSLELLFFSRIVDGGLQMTNVGVVHVLAGLVGPGVGGVLLKEISIERTAEIAKISLHKMILEMTKLGIPSNLTKEDFNRIL